MIHVLQNLLTQAWLEISLARLESWRLSLKAGVSSRKLETWNLCSSIANRKEKLGGALPEKPLEKTPVGKKRGKRALQPWSNDLSQSTDPLEVRDIQTSNYEMAITMLTFTKQS